MARLDHQTRRESVVPRSSGQDAHFLGRNLTKSRGVGLPGANPESAMFTRGVAALALLVALGQGALAAEKPGVFRRVSCTAVRFYVAKYSQPAAETWARSRGATDADIEGARRCLGGPSVQAASFAPK